MRQKEDLNCLIFQEEMEEFETLDQADMEYTA